jgi:hypothetical protein
MPSAADVYAWCEDHPNGNIGLRLPLGSIGVDSDAHKGPAELAAWKELERKLGPLPQSAPWCTSRDDGISGVRLLAVPDDYIPRDMGKAGEVIWHGYRYVAAPPSIHPDTGKPYRWVNTRGRIPNVKDLPPLPAAWLEHLRAGKGGERESTWTDPEIDALIEHGIQDGNQDYRLRDVVWKLRTRDTSKTQARLVWKAIAAKTPQKDPRRPWTDADFERHWDGADRKLTHPQAPGFQQPGAGQGAPASPPPSVTLDGAALLDEVHEFIGRFVAFPSEAAAVAVTLWAAHCHAPGSFESTPRLALLSPEPGSGKTRTLEVLELLTPGPMHVLSASPAAIFRSIEKGMLTLLSMSATRSSPSTGRTTPTRICGRS